MLMIKLFQYPSAWSMPNASPFCMKMETYLRMTHRSFDIIQVADPRKSPKGKLPVISDNGKKIADSGLIIDYLQNTYGDDIDNQLTDVQKAEALAFRRLIEEHLYWVMVYSRWVDERYWPETNKAFFSHLNGVVRYFLPQLIRNKIRKALYHHGMGRHSVDEIYQMGINDLKALSTFIGEKNFCFGDEPTSIDACVYGFLANIIEVPIASPLQEYAKSQSNLVAYCGRMKQRFYS